MPAARPEHAEASMSKGSGINRRDFLVRTGVVAVGGLLSGCANHLGAQSADSAAKGVSIVPSPNDPNVRTPAARWGIARLQEALASRRIPAQVCMRDQVRAGDLVIHVGRDGSGAWTTSVPQISTIQRS